MIGYSVDINDSKLAKITLQDSEQRYRSLIKATTSIIWTANELGEFVVPQDSWEKYTGQQWEEYKGLGWTKMIHPDDIELTLATFKKIITDGEGGVQYRHKHKNGSWVYLEAWGTNQLNNPDINGIVVNV